MIDRPERRLPGAWIAQEERLPALENQARGLGFPEFGVKRKALRRLQAQCTRAGVTNSGAADLKQSICHLKEYLKRYGNMRRAAADIPQDFSESMNDLAWELGFQSRPVKFHTQSRVYYDEWLESQLAQL